MTEYDLGKVVGDDGQDGATIWTTSTAPSSPDYTFTISNLTGPTGATIKAGDIIIYSYYWYSVSTVSSTTVLAGNRTSIRGAAGQNGTNGTNGTNGSDGVGISSISKTGTSGKVDTYTITYTNGNTDTFTVTNGNDASVTIVSSFGSTTSDSKVPSEKLVKTELDKKIATSNTSGLVKNDGSIDTNTYLTSASLSGYQTTGNLVTSFSSTTSDSKYPSEKLVKTELDKKVATSNTTGLLKNDGSVMTSGTGSSNWAVGNHTHSAYVNPTIADNLTTNDATQVLSAKQGKVLKDLIGNAITYINQ